MMKEFFFESKKLYYRTNEFKPDRQTVVFVHGLSGSSSAWLPYERDFENTFNILSFDLRGHGKSEKPKQYEDYKIEDFADDLHALTQYLKLNKFVLIGHSFGCLVVLAFLQKNQKEVSKVIFLSPNYAVGKMVSAQIISPFVSAGIALLKRLPFSARAGTHVDYSKYPNTGDWNIPRMIADVGNTSIQVYLYATRQSYEFDGEAFLGKITIPTLIIHGGKDTIFPVQYGKALADKIPGAKLVLLENADHILVLNKVHELSAEIKKFVLSDSK
jgi:pimeloyl-ACP methyl ester carboxylesterase